MAVADFAQYRAEIAAPYQSISHLQSSVATSLPGGWYSHWRSGPSVGAVPTAAVVPGRADAGSVAQLNAAGTQRLARVIAKSQNATTIVIADRLGHQAGLSGTAAGAQTTNLPTAALTRYATGVGVFAALEIYTAVGVTPTTATFSYTNSDGTAGRAGQAVLFGATDYREAQRLIPLSLQLGDVGVRAVASVTLAATTGTAGNFGVTLFKPLHMMQFPIGFPEHSAYDAVLQCGGYMAEILPDACLFLCALGQSTSSGALSARLEFLEE